MHMHALGGHRYLLLMFVSARIYGLLLLWFANTDFFVLLQIGYTVGSLLVNTVSGWRFIYGVSCPLTLIMGIGMWWLPASPRWLLLCAIQGKGEMQKLKEDAICCLCRLRGPASGDFAPAQVDEILNELSSLEETKEASFREMFQGKCLKALTIGAGLVLFQQVCFHFWRSYSIKKIGNITFQVPTI